MTRRQAKIVYAVGERAIRTVTGGTTLAQSVVHLKGTAYERGRQHGASLRQTIHAMVSRWKENLTSEYGLAADEVISRFIARTDFLDAIETWTPGIIDEIRGLTDGSGLDFETLFSFQCVDELWANSDRIVGEHCSSFGVVGDGFQPTMIAQTIDVETFRDGGQAVLHIVDDTHESFVVTCAGVIGFNGLNHRGVGVCCNAALPLRNAPSGLPVSCVVRGVLTRSSAEEAVEFLSRVPHATGQHYLIGDPAHVRSIECSAGQVIEVPLDAETGSICHTNHPLASDDVHPWYRELIQADKSYSFLDNSRARLAALRAGLSTMEEARAGQFSRILSSRDDLRHPICASREDGEFYNEAGLFTFASTLMELSDSPVLHVALGPPNQTPVERLRFAL